MYQKVKTFASKFSITILLIILFASLVLSPYQERYVFNVVVLFFIALYFWNVINNLIEFYKKNLREIERYPVSFKISKMLALIIERILKISTIAYLGVLILALQFSVVLFCGFIEFEFCIRFVNLQNKIGSFMLELINNPTFIIVSVVSILIGFFIKVFNKNK